MKCACRYFTSSFTLHFPPIINLYFNDFLKENMWNWWAQKWCAACRSIDSEEIHDFTAQCSKNHTYSAKFTFIQFVQRNTEGHSFESEWDHSSRKLIRKLQMLSTDARHFNHQPFSIQFDWIIIHNKNNEMSHAIIIYVLNLCQA